MIWFLTILFIPYLLMIFKIWTGLKKINRYIQNKPGYIFISVIIPCRNEERNIQLLLESISKQTYSSGLFEVIIVDDNSSDKTSELVRLYQSDFKLVIIKNKAKGKKSALQTGIEAANGDLILTTDADCRAGKEWISTISSFFSDNSIDLAICPVALSGKEDFFSEIQKLEFLSLQGVTAGTAVNNNPVMCNGANLAFTKQAYLNHKNDLQPESESGDDVFLLLSLKKDPGSKILWLESKEACVFSSVSEGPGSFFRQRARWFSKWKYYDDSYVNLLSFVTFATNLLIVCCLIVGIFITKILLPVFLLFILKSGVDYLILSDTTQRYGQKSILRFFIPAQIFYPFYVLIVTIVSFAGRSVWKQ